MDQYGRDIHVLSDSSNEEKSSRDNSQPHRKVSKQYAESDSPGLGIEDGMDGFAIDMDDYAYQTNQNTSHDRNSKLQSTKTPEINSIHKAIIKRVLNFGSFARVGLLPSHHSRSTDILSTVSSTPATTSPTFLRPVKGRRCGSRSRGCSSPMGRSSVSGRRAEP